MLKNAKFGADHAQIRLSNKFQPLGPDIIQGQKWWLLACRITPVSPLIIASKTAAYKVNAENLGQYFNRCSSVAMFPIINKIIMTTDRRVCAINRILTIKVLIINCIVEYLA